jgi:hypothetical protein
LFKQAYFEELNEDRTFRHAHLAGGSGGGLSVTLKITPLALD